MLERGLTVDHFSGVSMDPGLGTGTGLAMPGSSEAD